MVFTGKVDPETLASIKYNQMFHRADSRIRLQWRQEITVHECAKMAILKRNEMQNVLSYSSIYNVIYWIFQSAASSKYCLIGKGLT